jgi:hypothetical protein
MRFAAPSDVGGINLSSGPLVVVDGFVDVPDDATPGDLGGLATYGFVAVHGDAPAAVIETPAAPEPVEPEPIDDHSEPTA